MRSTGYARSIASARSDLTKTVKRFRQEGAAAQPVVFGSHRGPEAVLLPFEAYEVLLELAEDAAIEARVAERAEVDTANLTRALASHVLLRLAGAACRASQRKSLNLKVAPRVSTSDHRCSRRGSTRSLG